MSRVADLFKQFNEEQNKYKDKNDNVMLVDGTNTFFRCFGANPSQNEEGYHVGGMLGFLYSVGVGIRTSMPTRVIIVFDGRGGSKRRKKIYEGYKQGRAFKSTLRRAGGVSDLEDTDVSLKRQFARLIDYLQLLPVTIINIDNIEADDVISYLATNVFEKEVTIFSSDKDFLQLIDDRITVYLPTKKKHYNTKKFKDDFIVSSYNYIHRKCIEGDTSDNIPGIKGIGKVTIDKKLGFLKEDKFYNFDEFFEKINKLYEETNDNVYEKLINNKEIYERNYKLMQLKDVDISGSFKSSIREIEKQEIQELKIIDFFNLCKQDMLSSVFKNPTNWLRDNFSRLDRYRK